MTSCSREGGGGELDSFSPDCSVGFLKYYPRSQEILSQLKPESPLMTGLSWLLCWRLTWQGHNSYPWRPNIKVSMETTQTGIHGDHTNSYPWRPHIQLSMETTHRQVSMETTQTNIHGYHKNSYPWRPHKQLFIGTMEYLSMETTQKLSMIATQPVIIGDQTNRYHWKSHKQLSLEITRTVMHGDHTNFYLLTQHNSYPWTPHIQFSLDATQAVIHGDRTNSYQ